MPAATQTETEAILAVLAPKFESDYDLAITAPALNEAARLAKRYIQDDSLPNAAVHLLHRACATRIVSEQAHTKQSQTDETRQLDADDVMLAASVLTGIPVTNMGADELVRRLPDARWYPSSRAPAYGAMALLPVRRPSRS